MNKNINLLIVDDEEDIRNMLSRHFRFKGYNVVLAENGAQALDIMKQERMEVLITDLEMPEMNGIELLKTVKEKYPTTQKIVITGSVTMNNLLLAIKYGASRCVFKPLNDLRELEEAVKFCDDQLLYWKKKVIELKSLI